ncbi:MAG: type III-A CRISPR-associated RAMP protein Csm5 [Bryobacteraceae bacterium]
MSHGRYTVTCLTPVLVGDGSALSPIDYMVWKDQVNVLDQRRIFKLLAKGPRLDSYLTQVKRADRLDFASWGGFAQNFAERRIPFEHSSLTEHWNRLRAEDCFIPTFARNHNGAYLPGSALRGALRTTAVAEAVEEAGIATLEQTHEVTRRRLGEALEQRVMGGTSGPAGLDPLKALAIGDSGGGAERFKVHLVRTAKLVDNKGRMALGWKHPMRGSVEANRANDAGAIFAEMATRGSVFEGDWTEREFYRANHTVRNLGWKKGYDRRALFAAANRYAEIALAHHRGFAEVTGLTRLAAGIQALQTKLGEARETGSACLLSIGWGGGLLGKTAWPKVADPVFRKVMADLPFYSRAVRTGMPFPKTRQVVFEQGQPATLPGWVWLAVA